MSVTGYLKAHWKRFARYRVLRRLAASSPKYSLERLNWQRSLTDPTDFYLECLRYFYQQVPAELRQHREYFCAGRGFGEDAFHVLWHLLFQEFKPANFLEIGVFRGQTISLMALLAKMSATPCEVFGISPFAPAGDSVSKYARDVDYYQDTLANFAHFALPKPNLLRAYSTDPEAVKLIHSRPWDMFYIDGNHDYEIARKDWDECSRAVKAGGIIVLDDAGLTTPYRPPVFATGGHPGPSRIAKEIDPAQFKEVLQVGHNRVFQKKS
jgi:SAM-dependent methyltransferase